MSDKFLSSDEYDERAHQLYNEGQYDEAIDTLREGLGLYPDSVELLVGMGYARLAREEYAWARRAFEEARGSSTRASAKPVSILRTCCMIAASTRPRCFISSAPVPRSTTTRSRSGGSSS